jgi:hypothetical protein
VRAESGPSASTIGYRMREAEKTVSRLERQRDKLAARLGEATDHQEMARVGAELAEVQGELDAAEELWLELASQAEEARR